jgi:hypothetical protein
MFFITSLAYYTSSNFTLPKSRCFGFFDSLEKAKTAVACNSGNMHECYYNYLVIEEISEGVHAFPISQYWYIWSEDLGWVPTTKPEFAKGISNWSIG